MLFALDKEGKRIHINNAKKEEYFCPCCNGKMILKLGNIRTHHFSHPSNNVCKDSWHYDMTEWHYNWQNYFPKETQEIVKVLNGEKHRADVLLEDDKIVIEFQHSNLSSEEFNARNEFYNKLGYKVIWIFDVEEQYLDEKIENYNGNLWSWKNPKKTFDLFNYNNKKVELYLQISNEENELIKVTWCTDEKGLSRFATDGYTYNEKTFTDIVESRMERNGKVYKLSELYDKMIELYSKDHTTYYFGCPISLKHICASCNIDILESNYKDIMPCMECDYQIQSFDYNGVICKKRFMELKLDGNTNVHVESRDENNFISKISYVVNDERKYINMQTFKQNFGKSIFVLWVENNCEVAIFKNIITNKYVKITRDPQEQYNKYGKVYGYLSNDRYSFKGQSIVLYGVANSEWIIEWYK